MLTAQTAGGRHRLFRLAALLLAAALIYFGTNDFFRRSFASTPEEDPDYSRLFEDVQRQLRLSYLDQERIGPRARKLTEKALSTVENTVDEIYVENSDPENPHVRVHVGGKSMVVSLARITNLDQAVEVLKDLSEFFRQYYHGKRSLNDIRHSAVNGFLSGLDPHTQVFSPKGFRDFSVHIEGEIFGVGMYVGTYKGTLVVRKVLKGTPAERAGFKRGDRIIKIGEESTVNMDVNEAVNKIRGLEHSEIVLTVKRKENKDSEELTTKAIKVQRERVTIPSVNSKLLPLPVQTAEAGAALPANAPRVGFVQVINFDKNTMPSLRESLRELRAANGGKELAGLILDLRDNSGGLLQQASDMADLFIDNGELYWIAQRGREEVKEARNDGREPRYPIVVLANELSASGAEIVVGALQKNHRAVVLGTPTFGKGSVQQLHPLREDWQLKITVSEYLLPGKVSIQENGVIPDIFADRVILNDKLTNLFPNRRLGTERDYEDHIVSRFAKVEEPSERLQYLYDLADPDVEDPDSAEPIGPGEIEPEKDKLAQVALQLLAVEPGAGGEQRFRSDDFLRRHVADIERIRGKLFGEIVAKLKERGIDWSEGSNPESPAVDLVFEHQRVERPSTDKDDKLPKPFLVVKAKATNRSDKPLHRLKALTESDYYFYREQEFLFGRIEPGATVERVVEMPIPYYPFARNDLIRFVVTGPTGKPILEKTLEVSLKGEDRPAFAYAATLVDKDKGSPIDKLAPGQEVILKLEIFNTGSAPVHKGIAILRNETGPEVFLEPPGRLEFEDLAPGAKIEKEFGFRTTSGSKRKDYRFELGMADSYSGESLVREIEIPAAGEEAPAFANGKRFQPPDVDVVLSPSAPAAGGQPEAARQPLLVSDQREIELRAKIRNSQAPVHAWVTSTLVGLHERDPDKLYLAASHGTDDLELSVKVPLKKGTNLVQVVASDENGLVNREMRVVRRVETAPPEKLSEKLTERIVEAAGEVYRQLGPGRERSLYEAALPLELEKRGLKVRREPPTPAVADKIETPRVPPALVVEDEVLLLLRAGTEPPPPAEAQSRLQAAGRRRGLVLNFAGDKVEFRSVVASGAADAPTPR